ncbi:MAG TPA: DNA-directed RNA polymerase subunit P [Candidatus Nanoarchaeia archaeon]|nr:DNA-directed RNA polymerase subunit P [Candidatus Nanoarchaeia archaeon]
MIMATYKCFDCGKVVKKEYLKKKIRCPYCGSKILFKPRTATTTVIAR